MRHFDLPVLALALLFGCRGPASDEGGESDAESSDGLAGDARLSSDALFVHLEALSEAASDNDGNRAVGTPGYEASVAYVERVLTDLGLSPRREPFDLTDWRALSATVVSDGLVLADDPAPLTWSPEGEATGPLFAVDVVDPPGAEANTSTSGCEDEDFDTMPAGAVALIQRGTCTFADKVGRAEAAGAVAVLVFNEGQMGRTGVVGGTLDRDARPGVPVLGLSWTDGVALLDAGDGVSVTVEAEVEETVVPSTNVLVEIPGTNPSGVWVVGAHLDSVPEGPGINDNGTGVALLLQLAELLADEGPRLETVRLAFWGAEEVGLVGSLHHVRALPEDASILGNLNFDMIGSPNPANFVYDGDGSTFGVPEGLPVPARNEDIEQRFIDGFDALGEPTDPVPYDGRSDYLGFALAGVPTGGLFTGAEQFKSESLAARYGGESGRAFDACYHRDCDTIDNLDLGTLQRMSEVAGSVLFAVADRPVGTSRRRVAAWDPHAVPTWSPFGCRHEVLSVR